MDFKIGDTLVFIGGVPELKGILKDNSHFNNFKVGQKYIISEISVLSYGVDDDLPPIDYILFKDHNHGCYINQISKYFIKFDEYRESIINEIIN